MNQSLHLLRQRSRSVEKSHQAGEYFHTATGALHSHSIDCERSEHLRISFVSKDTMDTVLEAHNHTDVDTQPDRIVHAVPSSSNQIDTTGSRRIDKNAYNTSLTARHDEVTAELHHNGTKVKSATIASIIAKSRSEQLSKEEFDILMSPCDHVLGLTHLSGVLGNDVRRSWSEACEAAGSSMLQQGHYALAAQAHKRALEIYPLPKLIKYFNSVCQTDKPLTLHQIEVALRSTHGGQASLRAEVEEGNIEYKLRLTDVSDSRLTHLITQMKWRLYEGSNEAFYWIGVADDGTVVGITEEEMEQSFQILQHMADALSASVVEVETRAGLQLDTPSDKQVCDGASPLIARLFLVRCNSKLSGFVPDIQVSLLGDTDAGKSTLLGVLCHDDLDDGDGQARLLVARHGHEIDTGTTSSVSVQYLGVDNHGQLLNAAHNNGVGMDLTASELLVMSSKRITVLDLAGDPRYMKTSISALVGFVPDYAFVVVDATKGASESMQQYLGFAVGLHLRVIVVITKIDLVEDSQRIQLQKQLTSVLRDAGLSMRLGENETQVRQILWTMRGDPQKALCLQVSNVTGEGIDVVRSALGCIHPIRDNAAFSRQSTNVRISEHFNVEDIGQIVVGTVYSGKVVTQQKMLLGPDGFGAFRPVTISSIHLQHSPVRQISAGQTGSFAIDSDDGPILIRRGMVLIEDSSSLRSCWTVELEILALRHVQPFTVNQRPVLFTGSVRQGVKVEWMSRSTLQTGERATIRVCFLHRPEFVLVGTPAVLVTGRSHFCAVGTVLETWSGQDVVTSPTRTMIRTPQSFRTVACNSPVLAPEKPGPTDAIQVRQAISLLL